MCRYPLFETIAIIDGKIQNIAYHQYRYTHAMESYLGTEKIFNLIDIIHIPKIYQKGIIRCKISYNAYEYHIEFFPYTPREIACFKCIFLDDVDYRFKYTDRQLFEQYPKNNNEEIIIIRSGFVSDCSIGNLLFLKNNIWYSPKQYLLKGTQLSRLVDEKRIILTEIRQEDIFDFQQIMLINALNPFDPQRALPINGDTVKYERDD